MVDSIDSWKAQDVGQVFHDGLFTLKYKNMKLENGGEGFSLDMGIGRDARVHASAVFNPKTGELSFGGNSPLIINYLSENSLPRDGLLREECRRLNILVDAIRDYQPE